MPLKILVVKQLHNLNHHLALKKKRACNNILYDFLAKPVPDPTMSSSHNIKIATSTETDYFHEISSLTISFVTCQ